MELVNYYSGIQLKVYNFAYTGLTIGDKMEDAPFYTRLTWVVILPFTAGNDVTLQGKPYSDGRISTIVLTSLTLSFACVFLIVHASDVLDNSISLQTVKYFLLAFLATGVVSAILNIIRTQSEPGNAPIRTLNNKSFAIVAFGVLSIIKITFDIFLDLDCILSNTPGKEGLYADLVYNSCLLLFNLLQIFTFVQLINTQSMPSDSLFTNFSLMALFIANGSVWFFTLLFQSQKQNVWIEIDHALKRNITEQNTCLRLNNSVGNKGLDIAHQLLNPFNIGFSLAAVGVIAATWNEVGTNSNISNTESFYDLNQENRYLLESRRNSEERSCCSFFSRFMYVALFIVIGSFLVVNLVYMMILILDIPLEGDSEVFFYCTKYGHKVLLVICPLVGFYKLQEQTTITRPNSLKSDELVLILSLTGVFAYEVFRVIASFVCDVVSKGISSETVYGERFDTIALVISDCYQTTFLFQAKRCSTYRQRRHSFTVEDACFLLVLINTGTWLVDIFGEFRYQQITPLQEACYGTQFWYNVKHLLSPLIVFYRLKCSMLFYALYRDFKHSPNTQEVRQTYHQD